MGPSNRPRGRTQMNNRKLIGKMTGTAILAALIFIFQIIGNYVSIAGISINLALIPIAIGAILYGPWSGLLLGVINGVCVLPGSGLFFGISPFFTVLCCVLKTGLAGFISGWVFKLFKGKGLIPGMFVCSLLVPVINTGVFSLFALTLFRNGLVEYFGVDNSQFVSFLFLALIGINFIFEVTSIIILSPSIVMLLKKVIKSSTLGDDIGDKLNSKKEATLASEE